MLKSIFWRGFERLLTAKANRMVARFEKKTRDPQGVQKKVLDEIIRRARRTGFGKDHHFGEVHTLADFRRRVPVAGFERHRPYVDRVRAGEVDALFDGEEILMFALTSGTSQDRKFIPITKRSLALYRDGWYLWGVTMFNQYRDLVFKPRLGMAGDPEEFKENGVACGSISGLTSTLQSSFIRRMYVLPPASLTVHKSATKYYLAWRLSLARDVGMWISPNPSTHVELAKFGASHADSLIKDVRDGTVNPDFEIPADCLAGREKFLKPDAELANRLEQIREQTDAFRPTDIWPSMRMIACWLGGTVRPYLQMFPEFLGDVVTRDIGLIATEGRMTVPQTDGTSAGVLEISGIFFEFIPIEEIDSQQPTVLEAHELQEGKEYFILMTTPNGLYRYDIRDVVRCVGFSNRTPLLEFLHKGQGISNLTGEKLTENQVVAAAEFAAKENHVTLARYTVAPRWNEGKPYYVMFLEAGSGAAAVSDRLAADFDAELIRINCEYESKRDSGRLLPAVVEAVSADRWDSWLENQLSTRGGSREQFKQSYLITEMEKVADLAAESAAAR